MADTTIVRFGGKSAEQAAYKLLHDVAQQERKLDTHGIKITTRTRNGFWKPMPNVYRRRRAPSPASRPPCRPPSPPA